MYRTETRKLRYSSHDESGLARVLSFLKSHDTEYLSGQDLSDVLKISRVAVWKHIKKIRQLGYSVESRQKLGYRLESGTDMLLPWEIASNLNTKFIGRHAYYFDVLDSTQRQAASMAADGAEEGTVVIAGTQLEGRGRDGRRWISPEGGIWVSVILRPKFDISAATLFPMTASLALSRAIKNSLGIQTELKWPNDITLKGKKVAGILVDASLESNKIQDLILGVGINYSIDAKKVDRQIKDTPNYYGVTSLVKNAQGGQQHMVKSFLEEMERVYTQMNLGRTEGMVREWTECSSTIGKRVRINAVDREIAGKALRIDEDGALVVAERSGTVRIMAGDVMHA